MRINSICRLSKNHTAQKQSLGVSKNLNNYTQVFKGKFQVQTPQSPQTTIDWALNWDREARKQELDALYRKSVKGMSFWMRNFSQEPEKLRAACDKMLEREEIASRALIQNSVDLLKQQNANTKEAKKNAEDKMSIEKRAQSVQKMENAVKIANAFKTSFDGTLDDNIAGYEAQKQIVRDLFIDQVAMEKAGLEAEVPNSILLYGPIGTGKTTFAHAIAHETNSEPIELNPEVQEFTKEVQDQLKAARERYLNTGRRTIIIINEIETYLELTQDNMNPVARMKSWLDRCAQLPADNFQSAYATTFIFTTNHPTLLNNEILNREEKIKKLIPLEPASEGNIEEIIKFYIHRFDPNSEIINVEDIDFEKIIQKMNPNDEKGAYGNDKIKKITQLACSDFNKDIDGKKTFEQYLNERIDKTKRNITSEMLKNHREQLEELYED